MTSTHEQAEVRQLTVIASAEFTAEMAEDLARMCVHAKEGERVFLEICDWGVWGVTSAGVRMFIGSTEKALGNAD